MARKSDDFTYTVETLAVLSGWEPNRIYQDVHREDVNIGQLREAILWLASNGNPDLRAEIARRVIPPVLGARRKTRENEKVFDLAHSYDVMLAIFMKDRESRNRRATKIKKRRLRREATLSNESAPSAL